MHQVVSIQRLNHYYQEGRKKKQVLFDIDFEINSQEVVILTGESGSGKTTLLSLIGCLRSVQHGSLNVLGQELNGVSEVQRMKIRRRIGYVFQHFNLLEFMTVLQNVMVSLELQDNYGYQDAVVQATEILDAVGLKRQMHMYPRDLSGGQKQRVAIARSLVHRPPLLLADEPTSALDRRTGREVIELITDLAQLQSSAVLIVTHDSRIFNITNRLIRMEDGYLNLDYQERLSLILPTLSDKQLIQLSQKLEILTFLPGENIIRQGEVADKFYILLEGEVEVIQESPDGEIQVLKTLKPNHFFGEVGLLYKALRIVTVRATRDGGVKVIVVSDQEFNKILADSDMTQALLEQRASQILTANLYQLYASDKIKKNGTKFISHQFKPGQLIIDKGDLLVAVYVVLEGAAVSFERTDINRKIVKTFYPLDYFGAIDIITRRKSSCQICADPNTGANLLIIDRSAFQALYLSSNTVPLQLSSLDLISDNTLSGNIEDDL